MKLEGKTAVVTGGAKGIGEATAVGFAKEGANVVILDVDAERLEKTKKECEEYGVKVLTFICDIRSEDAVNDCAKEVYKVFENVEIVANVAGVWVADESELYDPSEKAYLINTADSMWKRFIDINIMGTMHVTRAFLPKMMKNKYGKVVNVASVAGISGIPTMNAYSATKGAVIAFTKSLAHELAEFNINVNCVSPGSISTEGRYAPPSFMGISTPKQQADVIVYLASDDASFITGQNIAVDGGRTLSLKCE